MQDNPPASKELRYPANARQGSRMKQASTDTEAVRHGPQPECFSAAKGMLQAVRVLLSFRAIREARNERYWPARDGKTEMGAQTPRTFARCVLSASVRGVQCPSPSPSRGVCAPILAWIYSWERTS